MRRIAAVALLIVLPAALAAGCRGGGNGPDPRSLIVYDATSGQTTDVFTIDPVTGKSKNLTKGTGFNGMPGWSNDHSRILFSSDRDAEPRMYDLYTMKSDGSDIRRVTNTPDVAEWSAKFSPDNTRIGLIEKRKDGYFIVVMDADASNARTLAGPFKFAEFPAWSRDGAELAFSGMRQGQNTTDILGVTMETGEVRTIIGTRGSKMCPHYSRDNRYLNYAMTKAGEEGNGPDVYVHDLWSGDASQDRRLTTDPARDDYATPSPDGKSFVFVSMRDGNFELYLMDADGSNQRRLTDTPARENVPDW